MSSLDASDFDACYIYAELLCIDAPSKLRQSMCLLVCQSVFAAALLATALR